MDRFQRDDPKSGQSVQVTLYDPIAMEHRLDDYREASLHFEDGRQYLTAFWRDPRERGQHWIEEPGMVIVHDISNEWILTAVDDILARGTVAAAFEAITVGG